MKAVVYFVPGFEEVEALSVVDVLRRGGVDTVMAGVQGTRVTGAHQITVEMDTTIDQIDHEEVDIMILPGGPGTHQLSESETLVSSLKRFKAEGKWLAAICAAPSVLGQAGLLEGEKAISYPGFEEQLLGAQVVNEKVVVSNRVITAIGAGAALEFGFKILEVLKDKETAEEVRERMMAK